jgi:predicted dehydrogenase
MRESGSSAAGEQRPIKVGVVGLGHLGRHHARLLSGLAGAHVVGFADPEPERLRKASDEYGAPGFPSHEALMDAGPEAVCVVVPTQLHREVAGYFLERGIDVLVEKPITPTEAEAKELIELAEAKSLILQVGHVERFNPAIRKIRDLGLRPRYLESQRQSPFSFRSTDIGVVLDLMIHDLDLVQALVGEPARVVDAFGGAILTPREDLASAVLKFEGGAAAQLMANRVALKPMRRMRLFAPDAYASIDFHERQGTLIRKNPGWDLQQLDVTAVDPQKIDVWKYVFEGLLTVEQLQLDDGNPLEDELNSFLRACRDRTPPEVSGEDGRRAVKAAADVLEAIGRNRWL